MKRSLIGLCVGFVLSQSLLAETSWTEFRGPTQQGISTETGLPTHWDESTNIGWKTPLEGTGWSSPVVANGKIWLTSATEEKASPEETAAKTAGAMLQDQMEAARSITLWALEFDLASGSPLQKVKLAEVSDPQPIHSLNSYASPTPILAGERLFCHFGDYGTFCLDTQSGSILWQTRIELDHRVGPGSSPVLVDDLLIIPCDGADKQFVEALRAEDGKLVWRRDRPPIRSDNGEFRKSYCTPLVIEVDGATQVVIPGSQWCVAYEPQTGEEIWRLDHGRGFSLVPRPVYDGKHVFITTGYGRTELLAIRPEGKGDVTATNVTWRHAKQVPTMPSPLLVGDRLLTIGDQGIASCFDTASGEQLWRERLAGQYSASPLLADGKIYLCSHEGKTTVLSADENLDTLAENMLDGQLMASPVPVEGTLLLRTENRLYRIREK